MPYATVVLDGKQMGEVLGSRLFKLAPGKHQLTVHHPTTGSKSETLTIEPNGTVKRLFRAR
jgi:hypothetical protein